MPAQERCLAQTQSSKTSLAQAHRRAEDVLLDGLPKNDQRHRQGVEVDVLLTRSNVLVLEDLVPAQQLLTVLHRALEISERLPANQVRLGLDVESSVNGFEHDRIHGLDLRGRLHRGEY
jgi:hypothetical protein